jgi:uncharacterized coiled-coil DUF342 family protein
VTDLVEQPWYHHLGQSERAEVERLVSEIERLRTRYDSATDQAVRYADDNERLRVLLREAANEIDELGFPSKADTFLRALEDKP